MQICTYIAFILSKVVQKTIKSGHINLRILYIPTKHEVDSANAGSKSYEATENESKKREKLRACLFIESYLIKNCTLYLTALKKCI